MKHLTFSRKSLRQQGAAVVEFAILLPLLILVFTGMVEYGRLMWHYDALAKATRDAARFLADEPAPAGAIGTARSMVVNTGNAAGVKGLAAGHVYVECAPAPTNCTSPNANTTITVRVGYPFIIGSWVPVYGMANNSVTLSPHTTMRYMR